MKDKKRKDVLADKLLSSRSRSVHLVDTLPKSASVKLLLVEDAGCLSITWNRAVNLFTSLFPCISTHMFNQLFAVSRLNLQRKLIQIILHFSITAAFKRIQ